MDSFLCQVARRIADTHPTDTDHVLVVFNNRRSLRFFQRQFAALGRTMFLPRTMAVDDLVANLSGLETVPNEFLLFELYRIHIELEGDERKYKTFDDFIAFGDLMMADFSELDQYCVDAADLFGNLHDLKEIGEWDIEGAALTPFQRDYLHFYRSLYEYYRRLRERLLAEGKAYSGMAYRYAAEQVGQRTDAYPWEAVYFVGFNALSECERRIIGEYVRRGTGHLLTDGDPYFMQPEQEAGHFLRKHCAEFPEIMPSGTSLFSQGKRSITIVECPENLLQCKTAGQLLEEHGEWLTGCEQESTAVVLADESLLLPSLGALPEGDYNVNISMGYAFCDTAMHLLAGRLLALWRTADGRGYYHSALLDILSDRHVARLLGFRDLRRRAVHFLRSESIIRCQGSQVAAFLEGLVPEYSDGRKQLIDTLFPDTESSSGPTVERWLAMARSIVAAMVESRMLENNKKELQAAGSLMEILDYLAELQQRFNYIDNMATLEKIYLRIAQRHQIPLLGEPLSGLQVMGMLETRNLDFRRVLLLSAGEGSLPASRSTATLIPYELKRSFGLPTYQEKDAVYAYNFYHLLLRAEEVYLFYSSESEAMGKGEPSRFLRQVESELAPRFGIEVRHMVVNNNEPPAAAAADETVGQKTSPVMQRLAELAQTGFSPTVFDDYIECPLRYFYSRVLCISLENSLEDDLDASQFGTAVHNVLQTVYEPYVGRSVDVAGLRQALSDLPTYLQREFDVLFRYGRATEGRNHFLRTVAESQLRALLQKEIALLEQGHTLEMVALEAPLGPCRLVDGIYLKGKADRIDRLDGRLRIIDYKTGSLQEREVAYISEAEVPGKWFQLMCYALLYTAQQNEAAAEWPLQVAIYPLRYLRSDVRPASWDGQTDMTPQLIDQFRAMLTDLCLELMNPDIPFRATDRKEHCRYCDVRTFCPRHP